MKGKESLQGGLIDSEGARPPVEESQCLFDCSIRFRSVKSNENCRETFRNQCG